MTLHLVGRPSPTVTIERHLVVGAAMDAKALADDLEHALSAIEQRIFAGNRAGAVNEIGRAHLRVEELRQFSPLIDTDVYQALSVEQTLNSKTQIGGTARYAVQTALTKARLGHD